jgi:hypothetical protein
VRSSGTVEGLGQLLATIDLVRDNLNPPPRWRAC